MGVFSKRSPKPKPGPGNVQPTIPMPDWAPQIIVLTGAFGSGCSTAASVLRDQRGFEIVTLSDFIKAEWARVNGDKVYTRENLQRLGDELRERRGGGVLIEMALQKMGKTRPRHIVFDAARNTEEIALLRDRFGHSVTVFAILTPAQARWHRIGAREYTDKGRTFEDFLADDARDRNEETSYGQQVELCVDRSDVFIDNAPPVDQGALQTKILEYTDLVTGASPRYPEPNENFMNLAYAASHSSKCLKRHVGAIVVDDAGRVVGVGYNENPVNTNPCVLEPNYEFQCHRDRLRNTHFIGLSQIGARCPVCGGRLPVISGPPWKCPKCDEKEQKTNLERFFFPDRAMNWCTAVHAEVWAMMAAGDRCQDGVLYTTTFPCFQCTEKLTHAGIRKVVYTEPYPDPASEARLQIGRVELVRFQGVRSPQFERIFSPMRPTS